MKNDELRDKLIQDNYVHAECINRLSDKFDLASKTWVNNFKRLQRDIDAIYAYMSDLRHDIDKLKDKK